MDHDPAAQDDPTRVLVVDDKVEAARMLAELLRLEGDEVAACQDVRSALAEAAKFRPDRVLPEPARH